MRWCHVGLPPQRGSLYGLPLFLWRGKMRILMLLLLIAAFLICPIFLSNITFSHSGRTDRDGGHLETATGKYRDHDKYSLEKTDRRYLLFVETNRVAAENQINLPIYQD